MKVTKPGGIRIGLSTLKENEHRELESRNFKTKRHRRMKHYTTAFISLPVARQ